MLSTHQAEAQVTRPVVDAEQVRTMQKLVRDVHIEEDLLEYARLSDFTRHETARAARGLAGSDPRSDPGVEGRGCTG